MRKVCLWFLLLLPIACGGPNLQGTYDLDAQSLVDGMQKQVDKPLPAIATAMLKRATGTIELAADGKATLVLSLGTAMNARGTWSRKGQQVTLDVADADGKHDVMSLSYDGSGLSMRQKLPTGDVIDLVWRRRVAK